MLTRWHSMGRNTQVLTIAIMLWVVGEGLWLHIQPLYLSSLGATPQQTGFILGGAGLARLLVMLPAGLLADRYGARQVMLPGWFLGMIGVVVIAGASNFYLLAVGFFLYGTSASAIPVMNLYMIQSIGEDRTVSRQFKPQEILTFVYALSWLAQIISPAVGGFIADRASLRSVFWVSAGWFALSTLMVLRTHAYPPPPSFDRTLRQAVRRYESLLKNRRFWGMYGVFVLAFIATILGYTFAPQYLKDTHHLSQGSIGALGSAIAAGAFGWNLILGRWAAWKGFIGAVLISGLSFGLLLSSGHPLILILAYLLLGAFEALRPLATSIVANRTAATTQGGAFGLVDTVHGLGTFVAPSLAGVLYAQGTTFPFVGALVLIPVIIVVGAKEYLHEKQEANR